MRVWGPCLHLGVRLRNRSKVETMINIGTPDVSPPELKPWETHLRVHPSSREDWLLLGEALETDFLEQTPENQADLSCSSSVHLERGKITRAQARTLPKDVQPACLQGWTFNIRGRAQGI